MAHLDTVSVEPEKWAHDPFGGEVVDDVTEPVFEGHRGGAYAHAPRRT